VPNNAEPPTNRAGRGPLVLLLVVVVIGAGLWYAQERSRPADPTNGAPPPTDDSLAAGSDTASSGGDGQTADSGTASSIGEAQTADSATNSTTDGGAQTADSGATSLDGETQAAAGSSGASTDGDLRIAGADAAASRKASEPVVSETTGDPTRITAGSGAASGGEAPLVAPAPESAIGKTPVDAPSDSETAGRNDLLATVEDVIERIESTVEEQLGIGADPDSELELQITYDASPQDAAPNEPGRTDGFDATLPAVRTGASGVDDEAVGSSEADGAAPSDAVAGFTSTPAETNTGPETEAEAYVEHLTGTAPRTIPVDKADHFVTPEHMLSLIPEDSIENLSVEELARDETLSPDTPLTIVREVEQIEDADAEQIIAESGGDLDKEVRVQVTYEDLQAQGATTKTVEADKVERMTVREALERIRTEPDGSLPVLRKVRYFEVVTLNELLSDISTSSEDSFLQVVTQPYRIESATLADLLRRRQAENPDSVFYIHTVQPTDEQGIWGIVHFGLIDKFARGIAIRRGEDIETYTVRIPRDADERLADRSSSFLGRMIDQKTKDSYVYNFREYRMGRNPDLILPGQELVIINFEIEELKAIYRHFTAS